MNLSVFHRRNSLAPAAAGGHVQRAPEPDQAFRFLRYFAIISFVCIACSAASMVFYFRHISIQEIAEFGEYTNSILAEAALGSVRSGTLEFLAQTHDVPRDGLPALVLRQDIEHELEELLLTRAVERVKIYNQKGWVVYSSKPNLIGNDQSRNAGVQAALAGKTVSELVFRDAFNFFDRKTEEDNLIQTYLPIRPSATEPVMGVFEIYVDVNSRVQHTEQAQYRVIAVALLIMSLLYLALIAFVRWAQKTINHQQRQIRSHVNSLKVLSARMLQHQEEEKRRIAFELHEGLAQTLSAVKMSLELAGRSDSHAAHGERHERRDQRGSLHGAEIAPFKFGRSGSRGDGPRVLPGLGVASARGADRDQYCAL